MLQRQQMEQMQAMFSQMGIQPPNWLCRFIVSLLKVNLNNIEKYYSIEML